NYGATGLPGDAYTFTVTASNGCETTRAFDVFDRPVIPAILSSDIAVTDAEFCDPALETSARVEVNALNISGGGANDDLDHFEFEWYTDAGLTSPVHAASGGAGGEVLTNNGAPTAPVTIGDYYVVARKTLPGTVGGEGCISAPFKVTIGDNTVAPTVATTVIDDTSCDNLNFEGRLTLDVETASGPGNVATYTYEWGATPQPLVNSSGNNGDEEFAALRPGAYNLTVINEVTNCRTPVAPAIKKASPPSYALHTNVQHQELCDPSGSFEVTDVDLGGVSDGTANFEYYWYKDSPASTPLENGGVAINVPVLNTGNYATIGAGTYYVVAKRLPNIG